MTIIDSGIAITLTAHSVVRNMNGKLFDITPVENEDVRTTMNFVPHIGDDAKFFAVVKRSITIDCPSAMQP